MKLAGKTVLVCDCEGSMPLDGKALEKACASAGGAEGDLSLATQLCRRQLERFEAAAQEANTAGAPLLVACTQEAPVFLEAIEETFGGGEDVPEVQFTNIRERAGWSDAAKDKSAKPDLTAKIAALLSAAAQDMEASRTVSMKSDGVTLVLGRDEQAIKAARDLASRLDVTLVLEPGPDLLPPAVVEVPTFRGKTAGAGGHLGAFQVRVETFIPAKTSSRGTLEWEGAPQSGSFECDLILDLRGGAPLFPHADKRDGYFNPDPKSPAEVARALFEITDLVGEFEKPRYVDYDAGLCAHARNQITGCSRCLDACPAGAITPNGDQVTIDPYVCGGCGVCASVCPTGAAGYALPKSDGLISRLRAMVSGYLKAGGGNPVVLAHDPNEGQETVDLMARLGRGLPANVLPIAVNEVTQVGLDFVLSATALGAQQTVILLPRKRVQEAEPQLEALKISDAIFEGLGYGTDRVQVVHADDPGAVEETLWNLPRVTPVPTGDFLPLGKKRALMRLALDQLHANAPAPVEEIQLPQGAPFGRVEVDVAGCTLCLACVGACPASALRDNPDKPQLSFIQDACVQCGLCKSTCPEKVISLKPLVSFRDADKAPAVVKEEDPFHCVRCGKPYGTRASIERMADKLSGHSMFQGDAIDRLRMCDDCRVINVFDDKHPLAGAPRPLPRTTDDYLRERDELRAKAEADMKEKGLAPKSDKDEDV